MEASAAVAIAQATVPALGGSEDGTLPAHGRMATSFLSSPPALAGGVEMTRFPGRAAEAALRLLLVRANGRQHSTLAVGIDTAAAPTAPNNDAQNNDVDDQARLHTALDQLCLHLAQAELRLPASIIEDQSHDGVPWDDLHMVSFVVNAGEEFGVGPVERGVGYALVAADGQGVLQALRALLEQAESSVTELREGGRKNDDTEGNGSAGHTSGDDEVRALFLFAWTAMNTGYVPCEPCVFTDVVRCFRFLLAVNWLSYSHASLKTISQCKSAWRAFPISHPP